MTGRRLRILGLAACLVVGSMRPAWTQSAAGTGEISGAVVTTSVPPTPLARVLVTVSSSSLKSSQTVITDHQGRFAFRGLPAGSFTLVAARSPYVKTAFGAKRPGRPGTPINLAAGQRVTDVAIPLARGAAITGLVRTPGGEPAPGVQISATPLDVQVDPLAAPGVTDDRGIYRLFGLSPGRYIVRASVVDRRTTGVSQISDTEMDAVLARLQRRSGPGATGSGTPGSRAAASPPRADAAKGAPAFGYAPIYYPEAVDPELAETLTLAEGDERSGVDLNLQLVRNSTIEGRLVSAGGSLPSGTQVTLTRSSVRGRTSGAPITSTMARPDAAGTFRFTGVRPGKYRVAARAATMTPIAAAPSVNPPIGGFPAGNVSDDQCVVGFGGHHGWRRRCGRPHVGVATGPEA